MRDEVFDYETKAGPSSGDKIFLSHEKEQDVKALRNALAERFGCSISEVKMESGKLDFVDDERRFIEKLFNKRIVPVKASQRFNIFSGVVLKDRPEAIFVNASGDRKHIQIIGAQMVHALQLDRQDLFIKMVERLSPLVIEQGYESFKRVHDGNREYYGAPTLTDAELQQEFVAELMATSWDTEEFWNKLNLTQGSIGKKVLNWSKKWITKILFRSQEGGLRNDHFTRRSITDLKKAQNILANILGEYIKESKEIGGSFKQDIDKNEPRNTVEDTDFFEMPTTPTM